MLQNFHLTTGLSWRATRPSIDCNFLNLNPKLRKPDTCTASRFKTLPNGQNMFLKNLLLPLAKLRIDSNTRGGGRNTIRAFWQICGKTVPAWRLEQQGLSEDLSKITKTKLTTAKSFRDRFVPFYTQFTKSELCNGSWNYFCTTLFTFVKKCKAWQSLSVHIWWSQMELAILSEPVSNEEEWMKYLLSQSWNNLHQYHINNIIILNNIIIFIFIIITRLMIVFPD